MLVLPAKWKCEENQVIKSGSCGWLLFFISLAVTVVKYCNERVCLCVCVCVCLSASISPEPHARSWPNFYACCLWPWLGPPSAGADRPRGMGNFGGCPGHSKALAIDAAAVAVAFAAKRDHLLANNVLQQNHSVCQASANSILKFFGRRRCGLSAAKGWWDCTVRAKSDIYDYLVNYDSFLRQS